MTFRYACSGSKVYAHIFSSQRKQSKDKRFEVLNNFDPDHTFDPDQA